LPDQKHLFVGNLNGALLLSHFRHLQPGSETGFWATDLCAAASRQRVIDAAGR
jgi:hypothetical protein